MPIKLSVLVCSTHNRYDNFLQELLGSLFTQWKLLPIEQQEQVEIISVIDNKKMILGEKRSKMVEIAQGQYIAFVDDDDRVTDDYLSELLCGIESGCDVVVFRASVQINEGLPKLCFYLKDYESDHNSADAYHRLPNHLMCAKRNLALQIKFQSVNFGEDADYARRLKPLLETEFVIPKVLYYYFFNSETTETQKK